MSRRAFTLIELMVVISVLLLVAGIAVPNVVAMQRAQASRSTLEAVRRLPFTARIRAREDGRTVILRYESGNGELTLSRGEEASAFQARMSEDQDSGAILDSVALGEDLSLNAIELDDTTKPADEVRFYSDGSADRATIRMSSGERERYLRIDKDGTARWVDQPPVVEEERWEAGEIETRASG